MIRFFKIGAAKPRPTIEALRRADKTAFATPLPTIRTAVKAAQPITQTVTTMKTALPTPAAPARFLPAVALGAAEPVHSDLIERHILASENRELQGLATRCANALSQLVALGARASFLSRAIEATQGTDTTPESWLASALQAIESEGQETKMEHIHHEARRKVRSARILPLQVAVSVRLTAAETEIPRLQNAVRSAAEYPFGGQSENQYQRLSNAGLTPEQIALVGTENPVSKIAERAEQAKARLDVLRAELPALWAFSTDPRSNPDHLNGLAGFEALIAAAQNVSEEK